MARILAVLFGLTLIMMGVAGGGLFPSLLKNGLLFGCFSIDSIHNLVYLGTGAAALVSVVNRTVTKVFFILFGLAYAVFAGLGIARQGDVYFIINTLFDNYLFSAIAVLFLLIGLTTER